MIAPQPWHRLFGLSWMDLFRGTQVVVELEVDLSRRQQLLDLVILRKDSGPLPFRLPDGFEELSAHNLITFKSYQEALDPWALLELIAHYVNYRKQVSPSMQELLPESDFRLFAVCVRFPQALARDVTLTPVREGVYEAKHFTGAIRIVVVNQLPQEEHNAMMYLFSARPEQVRYGAEHYRQRSAETSTLLTQLVERYRTEGESMADALQQLYRDTVDELLRTMTPEELLRIVPAENILAGMSPEQRLAGLSPDDRLTGLTPEDVATMSPEARERLARMLKELEDDSNAP